MIDYRAWQFWLAVVVAVEGVVIGIYSWITNKDKAQAKDIKEIKGEIQGVENRVTKLEAGSISHADLSKVYQKINDVGNDVSELNGSIKGLKESVGLIHQHLLNSGGGKQ